MGQGENFLEIRVERLPHGLTWYLGFCCEVPLHTLPFKEETWESHVTTELNIAGGRPDKGPKVSQILTPHHWRLRTPPWGVGQEPVFRQTSISAGPPWRLERACLPLISAAAEVADSSSFSRKVPSGLHQSPRHWYFFFYTWRLGDKKADSYGADQEAGQPSGSAPQSPDQVHGRRLTRPPVT